MNTEKPFGFEPALLACAVDGAALRRLRDRAAAYGLVCDGAAGPMSADRRRIARTRRRRRQARCAQS